MEDCLNRSAAGFAARRDGLMSLDPIAQYLFFLGERRCVFPGLARVALVTFRPREPLCSRWSLGAGRARRALKTACKRKSRNKGSR